MATLGQSVLSQFGGRSAMADALNNGTDLHRLVASRLTGKSEADITKDERQKAKAVNFGLPGGMGAKTLRQYAKNNYGVDLTELEAERLTEAWFDLFPEMRQFLGKSNDNFGEGIAQLLTISCWDYSHATGRWSDNAEILGRMARKVFSEKSPTANSGRAYEEIVCDYFWGKLETVADRLNKKHQESITNRAPSPTLAAAVSNLAGQAGVLTLTGRLRADATYWVKRHDAVQRAIERRHHDRDAWEQEPGEDDSDS